MRKIKIIMILFVFVFFASNTINATSWKNRKTDYNEGLVIEDKWGNQFVWVPIVPGVTDYKGIDWGGPWDSTYSYSEKIPYDDNTLKYGGFWVSRFEVGNEGGTFSKENRGYTGGKPVTKKGATVWSHATGYSAVKATNDFSKCNGVDYSSYWRSGLVTGRGYDTILKWIKNSGKNIETDSRNWGNFTNSIEPANVPGFGSPQKAGYSEAWKAKNLYDIAGNYWEMTSELMSGKWYTIRGVGYERKGDYNRPITRIGINRMAMEGAEEVGFRMQLFLDTKEHIFFRDKVKMGDYISIPNEGLWAVIGKDANNLNDGVEAVSLNSIANVTLNGKTSYANALDILNNACKDYASSRISSYVEVFNTYAFGGGSYRKIDLDKIKFYTASSSDLNSNKVYLQQDDEKWGLQRLERLNIKLSNEEYWVASRFFDYSDSNKTIFGCKAVNPSGNVVNKKLLSVSSNGQETNYSATCGVHALVTLKNTLEIISGNGTKENPYILKNKNM